MSVLEENIRKLTKQYDDNVSCSKKQEERVKECQMLLGEGQKQEEHTNEALTILKTELSALEQNSTNTLENIKRVRLESERLTAERREFMQSADGFAISKKEKEEEIARKEKENCQRKERIAQLAEKLEKIVNSNEEKKRRHRSIISGKNTR